MRVESGKFNVRGQRWCITCFPDGHDDENADWICVDLNLANSAAVGDVKARAKFNLLDQVGEPVSTYTRTDSIWTFSSTDRSWGHSKFIKRMVLVSSYLYNDCFRIRCDVTVVHEICTETTTDMKSLLAVPPTDMHCQFGAILESKLGADVTFMVSGEDFMAHRIGSAARSPVFMADLFTRSDERKGCDCCSG
ncbi:hypothetical protein PR202_ga22513 [Eleusine coracana subsp. coracana]|uniref:MATH domain-containing protein n=1 Tax=Eleusine coracana subsp. coracana TaxID=191504 RepID=A0AAV5D2T4_ELECO|nr:hypothetical protein PR202_ga22513 [Eleusine coracana subsp. coracana]